MNVAVKKLLVQNATPEVLPSLPPFSLYFNSTNKLYLIFGCLSSSTFFPLSLFFKAIHMLEKEITTAARLRYSLSSFYHFFSTLSTSPSSPFLLPPLLYTKFFLLFFPRHPHVVQVYGACVYSPTEIWLVMEYADGGSLFSKLADRSVVCVSSFSYLLSSFSPSSSILLIIYNLNYITKID